MQENHNVLQKIIKTFKKYKKIRKIAKNATFCKLYKNTSYKTITEIARKVGKIGENVRKMVKVCEQSSKKCEKLLKCYLQEATNNKVKTEKVLLALSVKLSKRHTQTERIFRKLNLWFALVKGKFRFWNGYVTNSIFLIFFEKNAKTKSF